ncbi:amino acid racemase, partial [Treponema sp.]|uniref:aspartate/glutamate racemase family protein n=1 Tax=Treponema sp. TaxID=166 RepID=UPI0025CEC21D
KVVKKLGLIGGTGPESTLVYYREINRIVNEACGKKHFPEIAIESVDLYKALELVANKDYQELESYLWGKIQNLLNCGCEIIALTANTMHIVYKQLKDRLSKSSKVPFVSIVDTAREYAQEMGYSRVGLLGTIFTMKEDFFKKEFSKTGIEVFIPSEEELPCVNKIIYNELEHGLVKPESQKILIENIARMKASSQIQAIVLGCTELPLALNSDNSPLPCIDIMNIHIQKLCKMCL